MPIVGRFQAFHQRTFLGSFVNGVNTWFEYSCGMPFFHLHLTAYVLVSLPVLARNAFSP
jgi:hypothetical protein